MTPTVLQITGPATVNKFCTTAGLERCVSSFILDEIIYPPKNIAGKQCLVQATYCNFETVKPLNATEAANQQAYFAWNMNSLWSQMYTEPNFPMLTPALGVRDLANGLFYGMGTRVIRINDGPFPVKFVCYQQSQTRRLTQNYYPNDMYTALGPNPYASVTITAGTNDTLTLDESTVTIPAGTYANVGLLYNAMLPLMPRGFILRTDGNTSNTRLGISKVGSNFTIGGTARTALGLGTEGAPQDADTTNITILLHITPIE